MLVADLVGVVDCPLGAGFEVWAGVADGDGLGGALDGLFVGFGVFPEPDAVGLFDGLGGAVCSAGGGVPAGWRGVVHVPFCIWVGSVAQRFW